MGIGYTEEYGKSSIVGTFTGEKSAFTIGIRADTDAIPVSETNDVPYKSTFEGRMHACGHDLHMACLLGAARLLNCLRSRLPGSVKLIFQPAEEIDLGAQAMIRDGVLDSPPVQAIFGLHNFPGLETGYVAVKQGAIMASIDSFQIVVEGVGGHGGIPNQAVDALVIGASLILQMQTLISRNVNPLEGAVLTVGKFKSGTANNIIAQQAVLSGTVRSFYPSTRREIANRMLEMVEHHCQAMGGNGKLDFEEVLPPVINHEGCVQIVQRAASRLLGENSVKIAPLTMGGDDFALYLQRVPGCYFWLGATPPGNNSRCWHSPNFEIDDNSIPIGSAVLAQTAIEYLYQTAGSNC
jgi:amidohydrolase